MNDTAVRVDDLVRTFKGPRGSLTAVDHVSFTIRQGEAVALLGPNGAGKSTTMDMILGLIPPTSGELSVLDSEPRTAAHSGHLSAVHQADTLLPDFTVAETMRIIGAIHKVPRSRIDEQMAAWDLGPFASRRVGKCSGGERQRLRFALAMLPDPQILVLDEPTNGLDVESRRQFWDRMRQEARQGRTILFATHYLAEADDFASRVILVNQGRVVADGSIGEVRACVSGAAVTATWPGATCEQIAAIPAANRVQNVAERITINTSDSDAVARFLLTQTDARDVLISTTSLEDAFVKLTDNRSEDMEAMS